jgi:hypothetical protein
MRIIVLLVLIASLAHAAPEIGFDTDILKFGYISEGGEHSRSFKVSNSGDEALAIDSLIMPDAAFTLIAPSLPNVILQGDTAVFIIRFHPDLTTVLLHSNVMIPLIPTPPCPGRPRVFRYSFRAR